MKTLAKIGIFGCIAFGLYQVFKPKKKTGLNGAESKIIFNEDNINIIDESNYFIATFGKFKKISDGLSRFLLKKSTSLKIGESILYHGNEYVLNYVSISSIYYTNKDKTILYRISDHWSNQIGWIASCFWKINVLSKNKFTGGKIYFKKLKRTEVLVDSVKQIPKNYTLGENSISLMDSLMDFSQGREKYYIFRLENEPYRFNLRYSLKKDVFNEYILSILKNIKNPLSVNHVLISNYTNVRYFDKNKQKYQTKKIKNSHILYEMSLARLGIKNDDLKRFA